MIEFIEQCKRTESIECPLNDDFKLHFNRLLHGAIGVSTEAGELLDALKKRMFYNKPLDLVNIREEIGDILWYLAIMLDALNSSFEAEADRVIRKLRVRYPEKFDDEHAIERDLDAERQELERE